MIEVNKGKVSIEGEEAIVEAETMYFLWNYVKGYLIPKWGSKENAREALSKMINKVLR